MLLCLLTMGGGGTPSSPGQGGYPIQSWIGGTPSQVWTGVIPHPWDGVPPTWTPGMEYPHPGHTPGCETPLPHQLDGVPPTQTWDGVLPPPTSVGWGTPSSWSAGRGTPPPPPKVEQTHTCENITSRRTSYAVGSYISSDKSCCM